MTANGNRAPGGDPPIVPGFTVGRRCGVGSSAHVYVARRDLDGLPCALKVEREPGVAAESFEREAEVLTRIRAPGLIRLHDRTYATDGRRVLVLELCGGGTVRAIVAARGRLLPRETLGVLRRAAVALAALHDDGYTHGDVCAANVLVAADGAAVLADLGRARVPGASMAAYGTDGYLAPELSWGADPTPAADVYALGALGWAMLTGVVPDDLPIDRDPLDRVVGCPAPLREAILRCLAPDPARRPGAVQLLGLLTTLGGDEPLALPDGPGLGGALTYRIDGAPAPGHDEAGGAGGTAEAVGSSPIQRAGRHRPAGPDDGRSPRVLRVLAAVTGPRARAAAALGLGAMVAVAGWAGLAAWREAREVALADASRSVAPVLPATATTPEDGAPEDIPDGAKAADSIPGMGKDSKTHEESPAGVVVAEGVSPSSSKEAQTPADALPDLLRRLALAYAHAEPSLLDGVYVAATPALAQARADVERLRRTDLRYEGLSYAVRSVADRSAVDAAGPSREARLVAVVDTGPYKVVDGAVTTAVEGTPGQPTVVTLRWSGDGWRIAALEASAPS